MKIFKELIPSGIRRLLNEYIRFPKDLKRKTEDCEINAPIIVNAHFVDMEKFSRLQADAKLITGGAKITIKKYTAIGYGCLMIPGTHVPTVGLPQFLSTTHINDIQRGITINEDCWIGAEVALLSKCNIGRGAIIGARSVVTKDIPPYAVAVGMPAKIIATRFSLEQILEHERILYPQEERLSEEYLRNLFATTYKNLKSIGTSYISEADKKKLESIKKQLHMFPYYE